MKTLSLITVALVFALFLTTSGFSAPPSKNAAQANQQHTEWLVNCLTDINQIQRSSTRQQVEKLFEVDGGLQALNPTVYLYRKSNCIKVRVTYQTAKDKQSHALLKASDKVLSISKPYLERPYFD